MSASDPTVTLAVHCDIGSDAGFNPYQSARLGREDAVSEHGGQTCSGASSSRYEACAATAWPLAALGHQVLGFVHG